MSAAKTRNIPVQAIGPGEWLPIDKQRTARYSLRVSRLATSVKPRVSISTVVIAFNEEANIARCLESVAPISDEIIVVDSGSSDRTVAIARELGARVVHNDWPGYGAQKRFAAGQASHQWILSLDADEELSPTLRAEIAGLDFTRSGYEVPRAVHYLGRWIRHGIWYPGYVLRLFRRDRGGFTDDPVHESIVVEGRVGRLRGDILHYSYRDVHHHFEKMNEFTTLSARQMFEERRRAGVVQLTVQPVLEFVRAYVAKRGFRDGYPGLVIALFHAYYVFLKYAKLRELSLSNKR